MVDVPIHGEGNLKAHDNGDGSFTLVVQMESPPDIELGAIAIEAGGVGSVAVGTTEPASDAVGLAVRVVGLLDALGGSETPAAGSVGDKVDDVVSAVNEVDSTISNLAAVIGAVDDDAWSGTGNGTVIAILKKIALNTVPT